MPHSYGGNLVQQEYTTFQSGRYPLVEPSRGDTPRRFHRLAGRNDYIAMLTENKSLRAHLLAPDPHWNIPGRVEAVTQASAKHQNRNEDNYFVLASDNTLAAGVFDGVSGDPGSERASQLAAATSHNLLRRFMRARMSIDDSLLLLAESLQFADTAITLDEEKRSTIIKHGIATTAVLASLHTNPADDSAYAALAWVGDSRAYHIRDRKVLYSTLDDSAARYYPQQGHTERQLQDFLERTSDSPDDFYERFTNHDLQMAFRQRNLIAACLNGGTSCVVNVDTLSVEPGDTILLTSDGIHDNLTRAEIAELGSAKDLLAAAILRSRDDKNPRAKADDMTAILLHV